MSKPNKQRTQSPAIPAAAEMSFDNDAAATIVETSTPRPDNVAARAFESQATSTDIDANALMPGIECPFTDGCAEKGGRIRIHSDVTIPKTVEGVTKFVKVHQYRCDRCKTVAKGHKEISGGFASGSAKHFNRVTGKTE
jgi:hypothetical protein